MYVIFDVRSKKKFFFSSFQLINYYLGERCDLGMTLLSNMYPYMCYLYSLVEPGKVTSHQCSNIKIYESL